ADFRPVKRAPLSEPVNYAAIADTVNFPPPADLVALEKLVVAGGYQLANLLPIGPNQNPASKNNPRQLQILQAKRLISGMKAFPERTLVVTVPAERSDRLRDLDQLLTELGVGRDGNIQTRNWEPKDDERNFLVQDDASGVSLYLE
ncbi:MAG: hypothetical protein AAF840_16435, partial [Bacteroidota bacterium]